MIIMSRKNVAKAESNMGSGVRLQRTEVRCQKADDNVQKAEGSLLTMSHNRCSLSADFCMLTPDTRPRGRKRFDAAKARNLTPNMKSDSVNYLCYAILAITQP